MRFTQPPPPNQVVVPFQAEAGAQGVFEGLRGARAGIVGGRAQLVPPPPSGGHPRPEELREKMKSSDTHCGAHRGSGPLVLIHVEYALHCKAIRSARLPAAT